MGKKKNQSSNGKTSTSKQTNASRIKEIYLKCDKLFEISSCPIHQKHTWENYLEISDILEHLKVLEEAKIVPSNRDTAIGKFIVWLKENGAKIDNVSICDYPYYDLGLRAESNFEENDLMIEIPRKLIFNVNTAALELKDMQSDMLIQHMPQVALAIALLIEKNKIDSFWRPYLDILPKKYSTVLYMNVNDMMELRGSPSLEVVLKQCRNISRQYAYFKKIFANTDNSVSNLLRNTFTYEEYRWAVSTIMTRQNIIPNEDDFYMIHSLIPMWDICNHDGGKITTGFNKLSNCCECFAMRNFEMGEQIFIFYGPRSNIEFFVHSGFIHPENKNDCLKLRLGVSKADPLEIKKVKLLSKIDLPNVCEYILKLEPKPIKGSLLGFLRIFHMNENELDYWLKVDNAYDVTKEDCILRESIDKMALRYLITRLQLLLGNYPTTEDEDIELLSGTKEQCRRLAIQIRLAEKKILKDLLKMLKTEK